MKCSIKNCPGEYQNKNITHIGQHNGQVVVIFDVPAEVCEFCGDTLITKETSEHIFDLLESEKFNQTVPALNYAA